MRILGVTIPDDKRLEVGLTVIYGIGRARSKEILSKLNLDHGKKAKDVSTAEENDIRKEIEAFKVEGDLKRDISLHIKRKKDIMSYAGTRHMKRLPLRGQRTKTNSRTVRGNVRKTMGSGKTKTEKK